MSAKVPPSLGLAARVLVGAVLVYAGATKAASAPEEFAIIIGSYDLLPKDMVLTAATFLPWFELLLGWSLILGLQLRAAGVSAIAMFSAFLFAFISLQAKGIQLPNCGCFGEGIHLTPPQGMLFDSVLIVLSWLAWKSAPAPVSLDSWTEGGYTAGHGKR